MQWHVLCIWGEQNVRGGGGTNGKDPRAFIRFILQNVSRKKSSSQDNVEDISPEWKTN